jgi:PDZ domain
MKPTIQSSNLLNILLCPACFVLLTGNVCSTKLHAQDQPPLAADHQASAATETNELIEATKLVSQQISNLSDARYRVRLIARSVIEQYPTAALEVISKEIRTTDAVVGIQLVDMVSGLAMHSDLAISSKATELLSSLANEATSVGRGATNSLSAIADIQEQKAFEVLTHYGAYIGLQNFSLNGKMELNPTKLSLSIIDDFSGTDAELKWIRFLKSVEVVYFRGKKISTVAIDAASKLKQLRAIRFHGIQLKPEQLLQFKDLTALEHLGLSYVDVDDSFVPIITQLPITESIRLYGTKVTEAGKQQLMAHFNGLDVFRGSGGFLGISSRTNTTIIDTVTAGSAASIAGIRTRDRIIAINDVQVSTFDKLRAELAKYQAGDEVEIALERLTFRVSEDELKVEPLIVKAVLQEES